MSVSGKMYIANIDADGMGIHGHRLVINEDNSIEKVGCFKIIQLSMSIFLLTFQVPVWSFSSAGAKIIHLLALITVLYINMK